MKSCNESLHRTVDSVCWKLYIYKVSARVRVRKTVMAKGGWLVVRSFSVNANSEPV